MPKIHYSSQTPGRHPGADVEFVDPDEFQTILGVAPADVAFDCILEAKS